jgi:hypothetical protein
MCADDTQLIIAFRPTADGTSVAVQSMEECISDVRSWMARNFLCLNDGKTEFLVIGTYQQLQKVVLPSIKIGESDIQPTTKARNIGCIMDSNMKLQHHVDAVCKTAWFHLRNIYKIRKFLNRDCTEMLIHAFITSKLDYANSLLYGLPQALLGKLQRVQNGAARLVFQAGKFDHVTPLFRSLHWLPVEQRIHFKILLLAYKALHHQAPGYITDLLEVYVPARALHKT